MRKRRKNEVTCHCEGYRFPHRKGSGECLSGTFFDEDCTCSAPPVNCTMIDPPEVRVNRNCPVHGIDPDYERDHRDGY